MGNGEEWEKEAPRLIEEMRKVRSAGQQDLKKQCGVGVEEKAVLLLTTV
jgi:hypothetical protein